MTTNNAIIKPQMSNEEYHAHKAVSRSKLMTLAQSPKKYWYKYLSGEAEEENTDALRIGSAFHTLVLEPEKFSEKAVILPDDKRRPTKAQINAKSPSDSTRLLIDWWEQFDAENAGKIYIKDNELADLKAMAKSLRDTKEAQKILARKGMIEPSIFWQDYDTGIDVKAKLDFLWQDKKAIVDVKTTSCVDKNSFEKSVGAYGYDLQAFMCMKAVEMLTGSAPELFIFACVEKKPPYETAFYFASDEMLAAGKVKYRYLLNLLRNCRTNDYYPPKQQGLSRINLKPWDYNEVDFMREENAKNE